MNFVITFTVPGNISWQGHLGGFVGGPLLGARPRLRPADHRARWQAAGLAAVAVLVLVAVGARVAVLG